MASGESGAGGRLEFGVIGLGRIGGNLARQALEKNMRVVGFAQGGAPDDLVDAGLDEVKAIRDFRGKLATPRIVFIYVPAGPAVDEVLDEFEAHFDRDDIVVDGGNSYWGDSIRRHERLHRRGIHFVDVGTSGGSEGARNGACFMAGGEADAVKRLEPILRKLAVERGYVHAGPPGAGHFVKLVHNGIEFGMLQAIGEGVDLLQRYSRAPRYRRRAALLGPWLGHTLVARRSDGKGVARRRRIEEDFTVRRRYR